MIRVKNGLFIIFFLFISVAGAQTGALSVSGTDSAKTALKNGLSAMLMLMKNGKKDQAFLWFKQHYYQLHQYRLLQDSLLKALYVQPIPSDSFSAPVAAETDSVKIRQAIRRQIRSLAAALEVKPATVVPDSFIHNIERYIHLYRKNKTYHDYFERVVVKSRKFIPAFSPLFTRYGFPEELIYFIAVESAFNPNAISKAGAAGMFQFMPATAREYGLTVTEDRDERFWVMKSARASAEYLKDLFLELGDINLAFAAYNTGPNKIRRVLKKLSTIRHRTYWQLISGSEDLKSETKEYLPQIYAVMTLANPENAASFGFPDIPFVDTTSAKRFRVRNFQVLNRIVNSVQGAEEQLLKLNPELSSIDQIRQNNYQDYPLFVPGNMNVPTETEGDAPPVAEKKKEIVKKKKKKKIHPGFDPGRVVAKEIYHPGDTLIYRVQRGNTLSMLARMFQVRETRIKKINGMKFKSLRKGTLLKIPVNVPLEVLHYQMPRSERYIRLAERFGVSAFDLKHINRNKSATLAAGDTVLVIRPYKP